MYLLLTPTRHVDIRHPFPHTSLQRGSVGPVTQSTKAQQQLQHGSGEPIDPTCRPTQLACSVKTTMMERALLPAALP